MGGRENEGGCEGKEGIEKRGEERRREEKGKDSITAITLRSLIIKKKQNKTLQYNTSASIFNNSTHAEVVQAARRKCECKINFFLIQTWNGCIF